MSARIEAWSAYCNDLGRKPSDRERRAFFAGFNASGFNEGFDQGLSYMEEHIDIVRKVRDFGKEDKK